MFVCLPFFVDERTYLRVGTATTRLHVPRLRFVSRFSFLSPLLAASSLLLIVHRMSLPLYKTSTSTDRQIAEIAEPELRLLCESLWSVGTNALIHSEGKCLTPCFVSPTVHRFGTSDVSGSQAITKEAETCLSSLSHFWHL